MAQSLLGMFLVASMRFQWHGAVGLFGLWFVQFVSSDLREAVIVVYLAWAGYELVMLANRQRLRNSAFRIFPKLIARHW